MKAEGHHTEDSMVNCPQCRKKTSFLSLESHFESCVSGQQKRVNSWGAGREVSKCPWCDEFFTIGSRNFESHKKREHLWGEFECWNCQFKANFANDLGRNYIHS